MNLKVLTRLAASACFPNAWWSHGWSGLLLLMFLTGCAAKPSLGGGQWSGAGVGSSTVDVDFELPPSQQIEEMRRRGIQLPRASTGTADPRTHGDYIDRRVTAVGFGITVGGYLLYCEGISVPVLVPESYVDLELASAEPLNEAIYPELKAASADMAALGFGAGEGRFAYYRGAGGALIVPTVFSPATTPRIARTMLEVRRGLKEPVQRELKVLLLSLTGVKFLKGIFTRVVRAGPAPAPRPLARKEGQGSGAPTPRQPAPPSPAHAPQSSPTPAASAPAPGSPAPSPGLVQALTGNRPMPPVAPGSRLAQDVAVKPRVPDVKPFQRPVGASPSQNAQVQADIQYLQNIGAANIRVNQQQITYRNGQRVGINRPDLQFDYKGRRYHVEYEAPTSARGPGHQRRITANDSNAEVIILIIP